MFDPYRRPGDPYDPNRPRHLPYDFVESVNRRSRESSTAGGWEALGKLLVAAVVGFLALGVFVTYVLVPLMTSAARGQSAQPGAVPQAPPAEVDIRSLTTGQCYNNVIDPNRAQPSACADDHDGQVIGSVAIPAAADPADPQLGRFCRVLLGPDLAARLDQEALALTWSVMGNGQLACRLERGIHEAPLTGSLTGP